jgi:orotate phosphoribosyltransferase
MSEYEELKALVKATVAEGTVKLASGATSDFYIDGRLTSLSGRGLELVSRLMWQRIAGLNVAAVGGPTMGADPIIAGIMQEAARLGAHINGFIIRKEQKGHGMQKLVEGPAMAEGARVVIVEDVVTSGGSAITAIEKLMGQYKPRVVKVLAIVDRLSGAAENLKKAGFEFEALFTRKDLGR